MMEDQELLDSLNATEKAFFDSICESQAPLKAIDHNGNSVVLRLHDIDKGTTNCDKLFDSLKKIIETENTATNIANALWIEVYYYVEELETAIFRYKDNFCKETPDNMLPEIERQLNKVKAKLEKEKLAQLVIKENYTDITEDLDILDKLLNIQCLGDDEKEQMELLNSFNKKSKLNSGASLTHSSPDIDHSNELRKSSSSYSLSTTLSSTFSRISSGRSTPKP